MARNNTGNPLGSDAFLDFQDNVKNLDVAVESNSDETWIDRFGVSRATWFGMEEAFQRFLIDSGFVFIGDYAAGLEITARNQVFRRDGEYYRAGPSLDLPYTITGDWVTEESLFVSSGDQVLRQDLADDSELTPGASMIGYDGATVAEVFDSQGFLANIDAAGVVPIDGMLQLALNTRRVVRLPMGDFKLSSTIHLNSKNVLIGCGPEATRMFRDTTVPPFDFFTIVSKEDVCVRDLWLDSVQKESVTIAANRHCAIRAWDGGTSDRNHRIKVLNVRFDKFTTAETQPEGTRGVILVGQSDDFEVSRCSFYDNRSTCIFWEDSTDVRVHDNFCLGEQLPFDPVFQPDQGVGSFTSGAANGVTVTDNRVKQTGYTSMNVSGNGVVVSGNTIDSPSYAGITIQEGLPSARNVAITGNTINNPGLDGIYLSECVGFSISGNTITQARGATRAGIRIAVPISLGTSANGIISGNNISNSNQGLRLEAGQGIQIKGNNIYANDNGIVISNRSNLLLETTISDNDIVDNVGFGIHLDGAATNSQTAYINNNFFLSRDILTRQPTAIVFQGSFSKAFFGPNIFSPNYISTPVETVFANRQAKAFLDLGANSFSGLKMTNGVPYSGSLAYDPPSIPAGGRVQTNVSVPGAAAGDFVDVAFLAGGGQAGAIITAYVSSTNNVFVIFDNPTAAAINPAAGTILCYVTKP